MSRILVTGGAGFIGSHLCDALLAAGHAVTILDDFSTGKEENIVPLVGRMEIVHGSILSAALDGLSASYDTIVHLAALISGYDSLNDPHEYTRVNISGTLALMEFARTRGVARLIFASSSTVYGASDVPCLSEAHLPLPVTVYAATKLHGEHLLRMYGARHGFSHCSLRLFNVYGPRQSADHPYANVTCKFAHSAVYGGAVRLYGDGAQSRDFIYVGDVVRAFMAVLQNSPSAIYNVGTGRSTSIGLLISELERISGKFLDIERHPAWPNDVKAVRADSALIEQELGLEAQVSLQEGLTLTVDWIREQGQILGR